MNKMGPTQIPVLIDTSERSKRKINL